MKKLVTTPLSNTIWWASVNEEKGIMNTSTRVDVTDNAIAAVLDHLMNIDGFSSSGLTGYTYDKKLGGTATICAIDNEKVMVISKSAYDKLLEIMNNYNKKSEGENAETDL